MCDAAAHLVVYVLPDVPVRQWVLTAPREVRRVLALRPNALTAQGRIFVEEIARWQKHAENGGGETGAVTFVQRFTGTLGCFVHFHVLVPDGVITRADDDGAVVFREGPAPTRADIAAVAARVEKRMNRWLHRHGLVDERAAKDRSNEAPELSPIEACMQLSLFDSTLLRRAEGGVPVPLEDDRFRAAGKGPWVAEASGFNVHAGVTVRAVDRDGLERVCRYGYRRGRRSRSGPCDPGGAGETGVDPCDHDPARYKLRSTPRHMASAWATHMTTRENEETEPMLHSVSLPQYAAVQAGLAEGLELDLILESEGIRAASWPEAEGAWSDALLVDLGRNGPLHELFDRHLAEAQDRYGRRIPPLDEELRPWLDFVRRWSIDPEPLALLTRLGLRPSDMIRLHRAWSRRLAGDPTLAKTAKDILETDPGELPAPRPEPTVPARPAPARLAADAPAGKLSERGADSTATGQDDEPRMFVALPHEPPEVALDAATPPGPKPGEQSPAPPPEALEETAPVTAPAVPRSPDAAAPHLPFVEPIEETMPVTASPLRRGPDLPFAPAGEKASRSLSETGVVSPEAIARALPFNVGRGAASTTPNRAPPGDALVETRPMSPFGATSAPLPFTKPSGSPAPATSPVVPNPPSPPPGDSAPAAGKAPPLTVAQYASLCAELAAHPSSSEQTFQRYGLGVMRERLSVDLGWQERLRRNPAEYQEWQRLYQHYRTYFADLLRRGPSRG
jgi:hypothetical protein